MYLFRQMEVEMGVAADPSIIEGDFEFTEEQHDIWKALYTRQTPKIKQHACREYIDGFEILGLPEDHIPSVQWLNERITPRTGWKTVRTKVRY